MRDVYKRQGLAAALLGNPKVIILDEPTVGLDPAQVIEIRSLIKELGKDHTVIDVYKRQGLGRPARKLR